MSSCTYINLLPEEQCLFDSLKVINTNFETLDTLLCQTSAELIQKVGTGVAKINAGTHISFDPPRSSGSGDVTLSETIVPSWHVGVNNLPLHLEAPGNRVSQQHINSYIVRKHTQDVINSNIPLKGSETLTLNGYNFTSSTNKFVGGTLLPDGRVFLTPSKLTNALIYDPLTDTCITPSNTTYSGVNDAYIPGINLPDGTIYMAAHNTLNARRYDPNTDTLTVETAAGPFLQTEGYSKTVLLYNGNVFHVPYNSTRDLIYDPVGGTTIATSTVYPGSQAYSDGVVMYDGRVFLVPYKSSVATIFNPFTLTVQNVTSKLFVNGGGFSGGVLLPDGKIFCIPSQGTQGQIYNPSTNLYTHTDGVHPGKNSSQGGCLLTDGRVLIFPKNTNTLYIYDPVKDSLYNTELILGSHGSYSNGVMLPSGDVIFIPKDSSAIARFMYYHGEVFSTTHLTGFFY